MSDYHSEQAQLDAIKRWWNKYGNSLVTLLLLIALSYVGWQWYQSTQIKRFEQASQAYEQLLPTLSQDDGQSDMIAQRIVDDFPNTTYTDFALLSLAQHAVYRGDIEDAKRHLQHIIDHSKINEVKQIARIRLARILH